MSNGKKERKGKIIQERKKKAYSHHREEYRITPKVEPIRDKYM